MMKRIFIFVLALALFIAVSGGYGQLINSRWIARSFISADQSAEAYPLLDKNVAYEFHMNNGETYTHNQGGYQSSEVGFVVDQQGKWVTLQKSAVGDRHYCHRINLDNVCAVYYYKTNKAQE